MISVYKSSQFLPFGLENGSMIPEMDRKRLVKTFYYLITVEANPWFIGRPRTCKCHRTVSMLYWSKTKTRAGDVNTISHYYHFMDELVSIRRSTASILTRNEKGDTTSMRSITAKHQVKTVGLVRRWWAEESKTLSGIAYQSENKTLLCFILANIIYGLVAQWFISGAILMAHRSFSI